MEVTFNGLNGKGNTIIDTEIVPLSSSCTPQCYPPPSNEGPEIILPIADTSNPTAMPTSSPTDLILNSPVTPTENITNLTRNFENEIWCGKITSFPLILDDAVAFYLQRPWLAGILGDGSVYLYKAIISAWFEQHISSLMVMKPNARDILFYFKSNDKALTILFDYFADMMLFHQHNFLNVYDAIFITNSALKNMIIQYIPDFF